MAAVYDSAKMTTAINRHFSDPRALTDDDIAQLAIVLDARGVERARAKRAGFEEPRTDREKKIMDSPVKMKLLSEMVERDAMIEATYRYRIRRAHERVDTLQAYVETLLTRIESLEAKPALKYLGVFEDGRAYSKGDVVTHRGGMWVALEANRLKPDEQGAGPRAWQLAVKAGRDAR